MNDVLVSDLAAGALQTPASAVPGDFVRLSEPLHPWIDRKLGYFGNDRFVLFYYEPRGQEVIWQDARSYGFASGAWCAFQDQITPLTDQYAVDLGHLGEPAQDALVIDRSTREAYFARRDHAQRFLAGQRVR